MPPQPGGKKRCPLCHRVMHWAGDHWVCVNTGAHAPVLEKVVPFGRRKK